MEGEYFESDYFAPEYDNEEKEDFYEDEDIKEYDASKYDLEKSEEDEDLPDVASEEEDNYEQDVVEQEYDDNVERDMTFKDLERVGEQDLLFSQKDYVMRSTAIILSEKPFEQRLTIKDKETWGSVQNIKYKNPFILACLITWIREDYIERPEDIRKFHTKYAKNRPFKEFAIDLVRYIEWFKKIKQ